MRRRIYGDGNAHCTPSVFCKKPTANSSFDESAVCFLAFMKRQLLLFKKFGGFVLCFHQIHARRQGCHVYFCLIV